MIPLVAQVTLRQSHMLLKFYKCYLLYLTSDHVWSLVIQFVARKDFGQDILVF